MPASELRPHIVKHLSPHQSVTAQYIANFQKKAIAYLAINGVKEVTFEEAELLLKLSIGQETIKSDSSISRERVESILGTIMTGKGDIGGSSFLQKLHRKMSLFLLQDQVQQRRAT